MEFTKLFWKENIMAWSRAAAQAAIEAFEKPWFAAGKTWEPTGEFNHGTLYRKTLWCFKVSLHSLTHHTEQSEPVTECAYCKHSQHFSAHPRAPDQGPWGGR